ncbi:Copper transport ATP-binding protein NosF [Sterolibacterium denitrificans]|uniref:Copper transport ATP-binding protein NosF n=1 Tax=Sterolibacterium denitrificans TaxID=157592 RepID=A0A7Z7HTA4_9PROT|nr:Copper transport ATP-binding protein NosF [Sterolibacterium denitrificans]
MANTLISVRAVKKHFGEVHAVDGIDLDIAKGEIFGLIGHNGAGKSTMFKMLLGLLPATSGEIRINGTAVAGRAFREVRRQIGYLPENVVFYDNLTGLETLHFFADLKGVARSAAQPLLEKVGLAHAAQRRVRGYSKGMRQRLGFAQALLGQPALLFLDEPTNGLDPEGIREFYRILEELKRKVGVTIVITSHILAEIQERVDRLAIMKLGKLQALGTLHELREQNGLALDFRLRLADPAQASAELDALLKPLGVSRLRAQDEYLSFDCPRQHKMAVVAALGQLQGKVLDLEIREPSLEDLFLGYAG